jgi:undecaprenyl pyrophosphate phosphatase UppP
MNVSKPRIALLAGLAGLAALAAADLFTTVLKAGGVAAVVSTFGKDLDKAFDKITQVEEGPDVKTKVVPIISVNLGKSTAVGAAQVSGSPKQVDQVNAVAQPTIKLFGLTLKALIPVASKNVVNNIRRVDGVGVSGIVDIRI